MNDWLDYHGSGSSRAYASNTLSHVGLVPTGTPQYDADFRLINAYEEKMKKLKSEYNSLKSNYNKYVELYNHNKDMAESQESNRAEFAKSGRVLTANRFMEKNIWKYKKDASDAMDEAVSYLTKMKANVDSQKKLQEDVKSIDNSDYQYSIERSQMAKRKANSLFIPDELPSNVKNQWIKQSYFDMPADEFIEHAAVSSRSNDNAYNNLNAKLDLLYKSTQDLINLARNLRTSYESMISAARNAKKNLTLAEGKYKMWETAYNKIDSDIDTANISDMQKTALRNKLERILSGAGEISKINTGGEIDMNADTFNNIISNIQNAMRR